MSDKSSFFFFFFFFTSFGRTEFISNCCGTLKCFKPGGFRLINLMFIKIRHHPNLIWAASWQNQQSECAPSEDSDQPGHPPSLIRVFAIRMKKPCALSYPLSASEDSDQTRRMPRLIWVFAGRTLILLVLSCRGSYTLIVKLTIINYTQKPWFLPRARYTVQKGSNWGLGFKHSTFTVFQQRGEFRRFEVRKDHLFSILWKTNTWKTDTEIIPSLTPF